ncbi:C-type lectin domain family 10 member A-like isoform X1 [Marmota flaviventris]|uniref:C-type lectin domain family 10 member A-like isoform X1 n=1 Tax=Marmota flaviventris TaxID=93162 RepID=UPI003A848101
MVMKYEDLQHLGSEEENQEIRKAPPPQVGLWYICSEHRLILVSLGLNLLLLVAVCVIGSQSQSLQETITSLKAEVEDHRQELLAAHSLNQKVVSVESSLQKQEQDFKAGQSEVVLQVQRLAKNLVTLNCQLANLKNNDSAKTCCPLDWLEHESSCYWFSQSDRSWPEADQNCQLQNSHLVVVTSLEEQKFIEKHMSSVPSWMGLTDQNGPWRWVDGTDYERGFKYWRPNQPDDWTGHGLGGGEDCASFSYNGRWNDDVCRRPYHWICEIELGKTS